MKKFIESIKRNLESNGFPQKRVSLPTEKMYEVADNKGFSLNAVLEKLKEEDQVNFEITDDKIIFSKIEAMPNIDPEMMSKVQEMMAKMDPAELERIKEQVSNMSDDERKDMLNNAKGMGLF